VLEHITVLNLASVGPAARAAQTLADFGAEVIRIGPLADAAGKQIEPVFYAYGAGRGTRALRLDLKSAEGRAVLLRLAARADVLIESFRPGVAARLGIGYEQLQAVNPALVYCSTSGYGQTGPYAHWAGHDINYLAVGGLLDCSGRDADGCPALPGATVGDSAGGGMHACLSILAALLKRQHGGAGAYLDVAVVDGVLAMMSLPVDQYLATGAAASAGTDLLTGRYAWYGVYATRDARFISVGAIESKFYRNLCRLLALDEFADDQYRDDRQPALRAALRQRFRERERDHWVALLADRDTCVAPVLSVAEIAADAHLRARASFTEVTHARHGEFTQLAALMAGAQRRPRIALDDDTGADVLARFGYGADEIAALRAGHIVE